LRDVLRFHHLAPNDLLVVCDDVNLPLGKLRVRPGGSHGGQNGLRSIINEIGTEEFPRLRVGVGKPEGNADLRDYVLGKWEREEIPVVREQVDRAVDAVLCVIGEGVEAAMNRYNGGK
jgi:PTH1 family peptidyl-tRNA hydrolase